MPSFFAIVTIVLQKRAKLDYTRGGCAIMKTNMEVYPYIKIK